MKKSNDDLRVGDLVKAFDFEPCEGRPDKFVVGRIVGFDEELYMIKMIDIEVISDTLYPDKPRDMISTPSEILFDWENRITYLGR